MSRRRTPQHMQIVIETLRGALEPLGFTVAPEVGGVHPHVACVRGEEKRTFVGWHGAKDTVCARNYARQWVQRVKRDIGVAA